MIRASDLLGCVVHTESGQRSGVCTTCVHTPSAEDGELAGLVVGRGGMVARMGRSGADPLVRGSVIPWRTVTGLREGLVTVSDGTCV